MLAVGVSAYIKPFNAGELHSKETYKYGRFVTEMNVSYEMGTGSFFYLYALKDEIDDSIFDEWNAICFIASHSPNFVTKMSNAMD